MNIHGHNIKECSQTEHHQGYRLCKLCAKCVQTVTVQVYTKLVYCTSVSKNCVQTGWHIKGEIQFWGQTHTHTHTHTQTHLTLHF